MTHDRLCRLAVPGFFLLFCALSVAASAQRLPPKKPQPTPGKVVAEHIAALNACDWNRVTAQYDDDIVFLSKGGPSQGGLCGRKLIPEHTFVVGNTVNVA